MSSLVIGMGEVGKGLFDVLTAHESVAALDKDPEVIGYKINILHICFPYSDKFSEYVKKYIKLYNPELTIVYSTVPIGTCEKLKVVHSPVEGKHPSIGLSIQNSARWLGSSDRKLLNKAEKLWKKFVPVRRMESANFTEWLKLRSTSKYGINLVWTDYEDSVSKKLGMDYSAVRQFDLDYNQMYLRLGMPDYQRYILNPPNGKIGGHCVRENAMLLNEDYPDDLLEMIVEMKGENDNL